MSSEYRVNKSTGKVVKDDGTGWKPVASVRNKTTGEILIDEGNGWQPMPGAQRTLQADRGMTLASERANQAIASGQRIAPDDLTKLGQPDFSTAAMARLPAPTMNTQQLDAFDAEKRARDEEMRVPDSNFKERSILALNTPTFGSGPRFAAGMQTIGALAATPFVEGDIIDREGVSGAATQFLDETRIHQRRGREERMGESLAIEVIPGLFQGKTIIDTLGKRVLPATNTVSNVGRVAGVGGLYGAIYAGSQNESGTAEGVAQDAAFGGALGVGGGLLLKGAEPAATATYRTAKTAGASLYDGLAAALGKAGGARDRVAGEVAIAAVRRSADRSGLTMEQMLDLVKKYEGKPAVLAEVIGQDALNALTALTRRPGATSQKATDIAEARATMLPDRAKGDLEDASGIQIGNIDETLTKQLDERQAAAKPLYDALYKQYKTIEAFRQPGQAGQVLKRLNRLARTPILQRHLDLADKALTTSAAVRGVPVSKMSVMERWDLVKRSLDDAIDSAVAKGEARTKVGESVGDLVRLKEQMVGELDRLTNGAYAAAREAGGEAPRLRAAATAGQKALGARNPKEVAKTVAATLAQDLPAMQAGMVDDIATRIDKPGFSPRRFRSPDLAGKVRAVFGEEAGNRFLQKMDAEADLAMKGSRWAPNVNSVTGTVMESGATAMGDDLINAGFNLATGNKLGLLRQAINFMRQRGFSQRQIDAIGDLLLSSPEEGLRRLRMLAPDGVPSNALAPVAGGPTDTLPPSGGTPPTPNALAPTASPVRTSGIVGSGDLTGAAYGLGLGGIAPADSAEERARNMAVGAGIGIAGGSRTVGKVLGVKGDDVARTAGAPRTPQQAARFETPGSPEYEAAVAKGLDMSQAARMRRAKQMGFDKDVFHATDKAFDQFDSTLQELGTHVGTVRQAEDVIRAGKSLGDKNPEKFVQGAQVMPLKIKGKYVGVPDMRDFSDPFLYMQTRRRPKLPFNAPAAFLKELDDAAKAIGESRFWDQTNRAQSRKPWGEEVRRIAKKHGIDGFRYLNEFEGTPNVSYVVFDPSNIRSVSAAFDPDKAASPILTAGAGGGRAGRSAPTGTPQSNRTNATLTTRSRGLQTVVDDTGPAVIPPGYGKPIKPPVTVKSPGQVIAKGLRGIDRGLRDPKSDRVLGPVLAAGKMRKPKRGESAIEAMRAPQEVAQAVSEAIRRGNTAAMTDLARPSLAKAGQKNAQIVQQFRNRLQSEADGRLSTEATRTQMARATKAAKAELMDMHGEVARAVSKNDEAGAVAAAKRIEQLRQDIADIKRATPAKERASIDATLALIDTAMLQAEQTMSAAGYMFRTALEPGRRKLARDGELLDLLTNPKRAKDAYRISQAKPLGDFENTGQALVLAGIGGAGAAGYMAAEAEEKRGKQSYVEQRDAWSIQNKHVSTYSGDKLKEVQAFLNYVVPPEEGETELATDGKFGEPGKSNTSNRIKRYQKMRGLTVNGRMTWETIRDLESEMDGARGTE